MSEVLDRPRPVSFVMRQAVSADMPRVLDLLYEAHDEIKPMVCSEPKVRGFVAQTFRHGLVLVIEQGGLIVGTCAVVADSPWWSDEVGLDSVWLYVMPEHRRTPFATMMLRAMRDYAARVGLPIQAGFAAAPGHERRFNAMRRLYERVFGHPVGMTFYIPAGTAR